MSPHTTPHHSAYDLEIQHNLASAYDLENPGNLEIPHIRTTARHEVMLPAPSVGINSENTMDSYQRQPVINGSQSSTAEGSQHIMSLCGMKRSIRWTTHRVA